MIQEMSLDLFGERFAVFAPKSGAEDAKLAKALAEDAANHSAEATRQQNYAEMAQEFIVNAGNEEIRREIICIAAWHYERCAISFRHSVVSFESAAKIERSESQRRRLLKKAEAMGEFAMQAELAILELKDGEKKMEGGSNDETG